MAFVGMIIEEVEQLAAQLEQRAQEIEGIVAALTSALGATTWVGADHDQFHGDWHSVHVPMLNNTKNAIRDASQKAKNNANQQRQASAT